MGPPPALRHHPRHTRNIVNVDEMATIAIVTRNLDGAELKLTTAGGLTPVVILSHGPNGLGATDLTATSCRANRQRRSPQRRRRRQACSSAARSPKTPRAPGGAFDDRITWLSPNLVAHRLISAGRLP
jgi:hypothetical protein